MNGIAGEIPPRPEPTVSIVVPVQNGGSHFRKCLLSLMEAEPAPLEVIVVTDGSTDGSGRLAEEFGVRVIKTPVNGGPARTRNLGARDAAGDILLFVDADVVIPRDTVGQVANAFRCEPDLAALLGSYDDTPAATNFLSQYKNLLNHYMHQNAKEKASTFWGACGAIRREIFLKLGGFDESFRAMEDIELGHRLKQAGYRIWLFKSLQVKHLKRWGIASLLKTDFFHRALPWTELILRDRRLVNDLNLKLSSRISVVLAYGLLTALVGALWRPEALIVAGMCITLLAALNAPLYRFFQRKRGLWFALRTIPWHWLYYFYSGLAFAIGIIRHLFDRQSAPRSSSIEGDLAMPARWQR